jgi:DsbC/DsbD-like thiol-disulfide interchange protein
MAVRLYLQTISLTLVLATAATAGPLPPSTGSSQNVRATLSSETSAVAPGTPFWLGLRLEMQPGWHVYWKQPGDSGLPPRVKWSLPAGFAAEDLAFPYPQRFTEGTLATYGYPPPRARWDSSGPRASACQRPRPAGRSRPLPAGSS